MVVASLISIVDIPPVDISFISPKHSPNIAACADCVPGDECGLWTLVSCVGGGVELPCITEHPHAI